MSDGNVIHPKFGRAGTHKTAVSATSTTSLDPKEDFTYCLLNLERVHDAYLRGREMKRYLCAEVRFNETEEGLRLWRLTVSKYRFKDICDILITTRHADWRMKAVFYKTLSSEFTERLKHILSDIEHRREEVEAVVGGDCGRLIGTASRLRSLIE